MKLRLLELLSPSNDRGSSLVEAALFAPVLILLFAGAVDLGRAYYVAIEVSSAASSGALYGVQNYSDITGMTAAAQLDALDVPGLATTAVYGCECSDGTLASNTCSSLPLCSTNVVNYVQVNTTATYSSIFSYSGLPASFVLKGNARMRSAH